MTDIDLNSIITELNGKADRDLSNAISTLSDSSKIALCHLTSPKNHVSITLTGKDQVSGGISFTAPSDGYLFGYGAATSAAARSITVYNSTKGFSSNSYNDAGWAHCVMIPVAKNDQIGFAWNGTGVFSSLSLTFYYLDGNSSEAS